MLIKSSIFHVRIAAQHRLNEPQRSVTTLIVGQALRVMRHRATVQRRHRRTNRSIAKQKAWDVVFGRRLLRRLPFGPLEPPRD